MLPPIHFFFHVRIIRFHALNLCVVEQIEQIDNTMVRENARLDNVAGRFNNFGESDSGANNKAAYACVVYLSCEGFLLFDLQRSATIKDSLPPGGKKR